MNNCENLTETEWTEVISLREVREGWGLDHTFTAKEFADMAYGAKFPNYMTDGPGYSGPLYLIEGGTLGQPLRIIRNDGQLIVVADDAR